jgi:hypothetical protein
VPLHTTPFDRQPHLTGELLELRPLNEGDFAGLFAVAADPLIWEQHPDRDRCQEPVFRLRAVEKIGGTYARTMRDDRGRQQVVYALTAEQYARRATAASDDAT